MEWSDRGPTDAPHGTTTASEVLPTVSRPDGLLWPSMTSSGNDREKVPMFDPIGKGPKLPIFSHSASAIESVYEDWSQCLVDSRRYSKTPRSDSCSS